MIIILHMMIMMCTDFDHLTQQGSVFFRQKFHVHLFSVSASRQMRWVDVVEVGRDLIGIWARILQAKKHKDHWVHLHFDAKICDMHADASLCISVRRRRRFPKMLYFHTFPNVVHHSRCFQLRRIQPLHFITSRPHPQNDT